MNIFLTLTRSSVAQLIRERILYNVIFVALFLLFIGYLASMLVFGHQERVMLHFGLMVISLSVFFIAASSGANAIQQEQANRTLYLTLAKPVPRPLYYFSKWTGISLFVLMNLILLTLVLWVGLRLSGGHFSWVLVQAMLLVWVEAGIISALTLLLSLFTTSALTVMLALSYFFLAHNLEQVEYLKNHGAESVAWLTYIPFPKAHLFLLDTRVYYEQILNLPDLFLRVGHGALWAGVFLLLGNAFFYRKNL